MAPTAPMTAPTSATAAVLPAMTELPRESVVGRIRALGDRHFLPRDVVSAALPLATEVCTQCDFAAGAPNTLVISYSTHYGAACDFGTRVVVLTVDHAAFNGAGQWVVAINLKTLAPAEERAHHSRTGGATRFMLDDPLYVPKYKTVQEIA